MSLRLSRESSACLCEMKATNNTSRNGNYPYEQEERAKTFLQPFTSLVLSRGDKWTSWSKLSLQKAPSNTDMSKWASWIGADSQSFSFSTPPFQMDLLLCAVKCSLEKLDKHVSVCSAGCTSWNWIIEPSSAYSDVKHEDFSRLPLVILDFIILVYDRITFVVEVVKTLPNCYQIKKGIVFCSQACQVGEIWFTLLFPEVNKFLHLLIYFAPTLRKSSEKNCI